MTVPHLFVTARSDRGLGLFVKETVARDEELLPLHRASHLTLDLRLLPMDRGIFLRSPSDLHSLIHHACVPAAYIDWNSLCVRALRSLKERDEITLNYMTIYEVIATPFVCHCGAEGCYGEVAGFYYLPLEEKLKLELYLSPYLKSRLNRDAMAAKAQAS